MRGAPKQRCRGIELQIVFAVVAFRSYTACLHKNIDELNEMAQKTEEMENIATNFGVCCVAAQISQRCGSCAATQGYSCECHGAPASISRGEKKQVLLTFVGIFLQ
jgi:hypothetical protein